MVYIRINTYGGDMRRFIAIILVLLLLNAFIGCSKDTSIKDGQSKFHNVNQRDSIGMEIRNREVKGDIIWISISNQSNQDIYYTDEFWVETLVNDIWYEVPFVNSMSWSEHIYQLASHEQDYQGITLELAVGQIHTGLYRIIKGISMDTSGVEKEYITTEFFIA